VFDESDHNTECSLTWNAYSFSKVKAEEATNQFMDSLPEDERLPSPCVLSYLTHSSRIRFPVVTIHPPLVLGPQQSTYVTSSNEAVKMLMAGEYVTIPPPPLPSLPLIPDEVPPSHLNNQLPGLSSNPFSNSGCA